jgi:hypothetical protein
MNNDKKYRRIIVGKKKNGNQESNGPKKPFTGTINLDVRNSKPDWDAFLATKAPKNAPNVLVPRLVSSLAVYSQQRWALGGEYARPPL